jgi:hypothetical protein
MLTLPILSYGEPAWSPESALAQASHSAVWVVNDHAGSRRLAVKQQGEIAALRQMQAAGLPMSWLDTRPEVVRSYLSGGWDWPEWRFEYVLTVDVDFLWQAVLPFIDSGWTVRVSKQIDPAWWKEMQKVIPSGRIFCPYTLADPAAKVLEFCGVLADVTNPDYRSAWIASVLREVRRYDCTGVGFGLKSDQFRDGQTQRVRPTDPAIGAAVITPPPPQWSGGAWEAAHEAWCVESFNSGLLWSTRDYPLKALGNYRGSWFTPAMRDRIVINTGSVLLPTQ